MSKKSYVTDEDLRETIVKNFEANLLDGDAIQPGQMVATAEIAIWIDECLLALLAPVRQEIEKAYGGCRLCYGKGYATVNDTWISNDTDQDIGSPGGTIRDGNPSAMRFCTCSRGKQLEQLVGQQQDQAKRDHEQQLLKEGWQM